MRLVSVPSLCVPKQSACPRCRVVSLCMRKPFPCCACVCLSIARAAGASRCLSVHAHAFARSLAHTYTRACKLLSTSSAEDWAALFQRKKRRRIIFFFTSLFFHQSRALDSTLGPQEQEGANIENSAGCGRGRRPHHTLFCATL